MVWPIFPHKLLGFLEHFCVFTEVSYIPSVAAACDPWSSSADKIFWVASLVVWVCLLKFALLFVMSHSTCDGGCMCSFLLDKTMSWWQRHFRLALTLTPKTRFPWWVLVSQHFLKHNIKPFLKNFLWPLSVIVNSMANEKELSCFYETMPTVWRKLFRIIRCVNS